MHFQLFSQTLSVVGVDSTSASLGGAEFRPSVCQKTRTTTTRVISKWLALFFGLPLLSSDEVGTAFDLLTKYIVYHSG